MLASAYTAAAMLSTPFRLFSSSTMIRIVLLLPTGLDHPRCDTAPNRAYCVIVVVIAIHSAAAGH
jgi:hypothetical protein